MSRRASDTPQQGRAVRRGQVLAKSEGKPAKIEGNSTEGGNSARPLKPDKASGAARDRRLQRVDEISAGGLVFEISGGVTRGALIGRTDRRGRLLWSLPKGHVEPGESVEQAAVREVEEETGIIGEVVAVLGSIDYWFVADGRRIHKTVHHFLLRATGGELSDADIEVTEVAWVPLPDITGRLAYRDERGLVDTAGRLIADSA